MQKSKQNHTEEQIRDTLESATIDTAIALWKKKDWTTYKTQRDLLISLIRAGEGDRVSLAHMQFIYFVNTHLRSLWPGRRLDQHLFMSDLPEGHSITDASWQKATKGEFWSVTL